MQTVSDTMDGSLLRELREIFRKISRKGASPRRNRVIVGNAYAYYGVLEVRTKQIYHFLPRFIDLHETAPLYLINLI